MPIQGLSDRDLAEMRRVVQDYFPDVISLYTTTVEYDRYGVETVTSGFVTTVLGQISAPSGREREIVTALKGEGVLLDETIKVSLPYSTPITTEQVAVTSGNLEWEVAYVSTPYTFTAVTEALLTRKVIGGKRIRTNG